MDVDQRERIRYLLAGLKTYVMFGFYGNNGE